MTTTYTFPKSFNPALCPSLYQLNYNFQDWNQASESFKIPQRAENQRKGLEYPQKLSENLGCDTAGYLLPAQESQQ